MSENTLSFKGYLCQDQTLCVAPMLVSSLKTCHVPSTYGLEGRRFGPRPSPIYMACVMAVIALSLLPCSLSCPKGPSWWNKLHAALLCINSRLIITKSPLDLESSPGCNGSLARPEGELPVAGDRTPRESICTGLLISSSYFLSNLSLFFFPYFSPFLWVKQASDFVVFHHAENKFRTFLFFLVSLAQ